MAKRIFELAKELDVKSKAIIDKCIAEGIPEDKVKNHMATVSPGLEASIREWFTVGLDAYAKIMTANPAFIDKYVDASDASPRPGPAVFERAPTL